MGSLALWWRNQITDSTLAPLRRQLAELVPQGATLFDLGCANGRLLRELGPRIDSGLGFDLNESMITAAAQAAEREGSSNLTFADGDALTMVRMVPVRPTLVIASLFIHELEQTDAVALLQRLYRLDSRLLLADFVEPPGTLSRLALHFDELFSGHGERYRAYLQAGAMPGLLRQAGVPLLAEHETRFPFIRIWEAGQDATKP